MTRSLVLAAFVAGLSSAGMARADTDCAVPMANWQPREAVQQMAEAQAWTVHRIKADDGCYEIDARNAKGQPFEAKIDPATLAIVRIEYKDGIEHGERAERRGDDNRIGGN